MSPVKIPKRLFLELSEMILKFKYHDSGQDVLKHLKKISNQGKLAY